MGLKQKAKQTKEHVSRYRYEYAYSLYIAGCVALGYWTTKKVFQGYQAQVQQAVEHETLRMAVAAGHEFQFDPKANLLWDVTIRPDMKAG